MDQQSESKHRTERPATDETRNQETIAIIGLQDASLDLFFTSIEQTFKMKLLFINPETDFNRLLLELSSCVAAIIVRDLFGPTQTRAIAFCKSVGIPLFYFTDDNFTAINEALRDRPDYELASLRRHLYGFKGFIAGSSALREYALSEDLAETVIEMSPSFDQRTYQAIRRIKAERSDAALNIAFAGGTFRQKNFLEEALPAALSIESPKVRIALPKGIVGQEGRQAILEIERTVSFQAFLKNFAKFSPDVLVHPSGDPDDGVFRLNARYKNEHILLTAYYLNAVPIVTDEPAFSEIDERQGVVKVIGTQESYAKAFQQLSSQTFRDEMIGALERYCRKHFSPVKCSASLEELIQYTVSRRRHPDKQYRKSIAFLEYSLNSQQPPGIARLPNSRLVSYALKLRGMVIWLRNLFHV